MLSWKKEHIYEDTETGRVTFRKSTRSRRISIRVHPVRGITVTVPYFTSYDSGMKFYLAKRDWVLATVARQRKRMESDPALAPEQIEELRKIAKKVLPKKMAILAARYGFEYNRVAVKHNSSNWGSCSTKGNINLNLNLVRLPEALCDYVILHELCHLRHHDHGQQFHALLEKLCTDNMSRLVEKNAEAIKAITGKTAEPVSPEVMKREEEARFLIDLTSRIRRSRAAQPVRYTLEQEIRKFRLQ